MEARRALAPVKATQGVCFARRWRNGLGSIGTALLLSVENEERKSTPLGVHCRAGKEKEMNVLLGLLLRG